MYDIKNMNIWKENSKYKRRKYQNKVLEMEVSKRREITMNHKCQTVFNEIMNLAPNVKFKEIKERRGKLRFPMYINHALMETNLEVLELSMRSSNCLHRAGYRTIGELVEAIECADDLKKIRNCGVKSIDEIMGSLFCYQYSLIPINDKVKFINRVLQLNNEAL